MLLGLPSALNIFMHTMNNLFKDMLDSGILDNILIYSHIAIEYCITLEKSTAIYTSVYL